MPNTNKTIKERFDELVRHLTSHRSIKDVSQEFSALKSNARRVNFAFELLKTAQLFPTHVKDAKDNATALEFRRKGNEMYRIRRTKEALECYTKSLVHSQHNTEFHATAFANRSAVLFEMKLFSECLSDIDNALKNNYPENLKEKLLARRMKAKSQIKSQTNLLYHKPIPSLNDNEKSEEIECASNAVKINYTPELGRHLIATRLINPGEILAVEKPFCQILVDELYTHCHECLELCYNLTPCIECTTAAYCSEKCRESAKPHHQYECILSKLLNNLNMDKLTSIAYRIALKSKQFYNNTEEENNNEKYKSNRYKEVHNLIGNTEHRTVSNLFNKSVTAAILFHVTKAYTEFFDTTDLEDYFKDVLLHNLQTGPCNFHEISELSQNEDGDYVPNEIGAGCYSFLSMFNHACCPNILRTCYGTTIVVRALETIQEGEQCFDNYGYHHALMDKIDRQKSLKENYFFNCNCKVCSEDWPLYQNLPTTYKTNLDPLDLDKLKPGNNESILNQTLAIIKQVEDRKPNKTLAELQEIVKQCYGFCGNTRKTI